MIDAYDEIAAALTAWREARGEGEEGMRAVLWVIRNRMKDPAKRWPQTVPGVCFQKAQFSCHMVSDPNASLWPRLDKSWDLARNLTGEVLEEGGDDPTKGANHYYATSITAPVWADEAKATVTIGSHRFYRL